MPTMTRDGTLRILNLGEDENRFSVDWMVEVHRCLDQVEAETEPVALMTTASGKFFSNGLDTAALSDPSGRIAYTTAVEKLLARFLIFPVPTVTAINGHAFGGGALLAMAHDFRVMRADGGYFCFPEVDLGMGFTPFMSALVADNLTPQAAIEAMTTGRRYGGTDALSRGLIDAIASEADLAGTAGDMVRGLAGKDRNALGRIKAQLFKGAVELAGNPYP